MVSFQTFHCVFVVTCFCVDVRHTRCCSQCVRRRSSLSLTKMCGCQTYPLLLTVCETSVVTFSHQVSSLQDVVSHHRKLNKKSDDDVGGSGVGGAGLKALSRDRRERMEAYQHMFYLLQTSPFYLAKLIFEMPHSSTTKFMESVIFSLFSYGSNQREEYLLLKLFRSALEEEIKWELCLSPVVSLCLPTIIDFCCDTLCGVECCVVWGVVRLAVWIVFSCGDG